MLSLGHVLSTKNLGHKMIIVHLNWLLIGPNTFFLHMAWHCLTALFLCRLFTHVKVFSRFGRVLWHLKIFLLLYLGLTWYNHRVHLHDYIIQPQHVKTNKMISKDSDQPGHLPRLIRVFVVYMTKHRILRHMGHTAKTYQTGWMNRLILIFTGLTGHFVGFVMLQFIYFIVLLHQR